MSLLCLLKKASAQKPGKEAKNFTAQRQATGLRKTRFDLPLDDQNRPSNSPQNRPQNRL
jgi:hypothetical protein